MYKLDYCEVESKGYNLDYQLDTLIVKPLDIICPIIIKVISEHRYVIPKRISLSNDNMFIEYDIKDYGKIKDQNYRKYLQELSPVITEINGYKIDLLKELSNEIVEQWNHSNNEDEVEKLLFFSTTNRITSEYFLLKNSKW